MMRSRILALATLVLYFGITGGAPSGGRWRPPIPKPGEKFVDPYGMTFRWIVPGSFEMGSPASEAERDSDEERHHVTLTKGFWMAQYEVTQQDWDAVMGSNASYFKGVRRPVDSVSWVQCQEFIAKLSSRRLSVNYRLPTEAEWEYACRAGTTTPFHFGETITPGQVNYKGTKPYGTAEKGFFRETTGNVGSFAPNAWGLYDMHGNVYEWCQDLTGDYPTEAVTDPTGAPAGETRVLRGGSWSVDAKYCRSAYRGRFDPRYGINYFGLRLVAIKTGSEYWNK